MTSGKCDCKDVPSKTNSLLLQLREVSNWECYWQFMSRIILQTHISNFAAPPKETRICELADLHIVLYKWNWKLNLDPIYIGHSDSSLLCKENEAISGHSSISRILWLEPRTSFLD